MICFRLFYVRSLNQLIYEIIYFLAVSSLFTKTQISEGVVMNFCALMTLNQFFFSSFLDEKTLANMVEVDSQMKFIHYCTITCFNIRNLNKWFRRT